MKKFLSFLLVVLMVLPSLATLPFASFAADEPSNVAAGRLAYIGGNPFVATDKLTDGNISASGSYNFQNLQTQLQSDITDDSDNYALIDLGARFDISSVQISNYPGMTTAAKVYFSDDPDAPIASWTYYGERPKGTVATYDIEGDDITARYLRVYLTCYAYSASNIGTDWGWLSEVAVMGTLADGEKEPEKETAPLTFSPTFGKIENYQGRTSFIFTTPTLPGASEEENKTISDALSDGTMDVYYTVTDAATNESFRFKYLPTDLGYEQAGWFCRLPVCNFGCPLQAGHAYTLKLEMYDKNGVLKYNGESAKGAFSAAIDSDFALNGPITPQVIIDFSSPLVGKSVIFMGDSITEAICERYNSATVSTAGWPGRIGSSNAMKWKNVGYSGATMSASANSEESLRNENTVYKQAYANKDNTYDLVIMQGGVNDGWFSHPVGKVTADDVRDPSAFDLSTLAGGIEYTFAFIKENYPTAKFGFILTFKMPSSPYGYTAHMDEAYDEIIKACEKWGVPYLDLYHNEEVENRLQPTVNYYALGDYVHPNNRGYDILFPYINEFTKAVATVENLTGSVEVEVPDYTPVENGAPILSTDSNIAIGKPVSLGNGTTTAKLTDANRGTNESIGQPGNALCYATVDLGGIYDINKVNVWSGGYNNLFKFNVSVSLDGVSFTVVGSKNDNNMVFPEGYTVGFDTVSAKYVRITGLYNSKSSGSYPVAEISVYGAMNEELTFAGIDLTESDINKVVLPDGKTQTDKLNDGNTASDPMTIGVIEGSPIIVDMGKQVSLSRIDFIMAESDSAFTVFGSTDKNEWVKLFSKTLEYADSKPTFEVSGSYRYLKVRYDKGRTSIADGLVVFFEIKPYDQAGNLVTGMSAAGYNNAVDGKDSTYSYIGKPSEGITVDLGSARSIYKVVLYVTDKNMTYNLLVSENGSSYSPFGGTTANDGYDPAVGYISYGESYARYIKIVPTNYVDEAFSAYEIEVYADSHIHDFSGDWCHDEDDHWKVCASDTCDAVEHKAAHSFKGNVTVAPTATDEGEIVYTCTVCGYSKTEVLPADPLLAMDVVSQGKNAWLYTQSSDKTGPYTLVSKNEITDGKPGDNWAYGAFGTIYAKIDLGGYYDLGAINVIAYSPYRHGWSVYVSVDDWEYTKIATVGTIEHPAEGIGVELDGTVARYVKIVADYYVTPAQFSFREVIVYGVPSVKDVHPYDGDWHSDEENHWRVCSLHGEIGKNAAHDFDIGKVTAEPTATTDGQKILTCLTCGYEKTVVLPADPTIGLINASLGKPAWINTASGESSSDFQLKSNTMLTNGVVNEWNFGYGAWNSGLMYGLVDLGVVYDISVVTFAGYPGARQAWSVYVSKDGENFTKVASVASQVHPAEGVTVVFDTVEARYVKLLMEGYSYSPTVCCMSEISVYGTVSDVPLKNIASQATVTLPNGTVTDALTNGEPDDFINISGIHAGYVTADLNDVLPITKIIVSTYESDSAYLILGSVDGESWTVLGQKTHNDKAADYTLNLLGEYRYIRVQGLDKRGIGDYAAAIKFTTGIQVYFGNEQYGTTLKAENSVNSGWFFINKVSAYPIVDLGELIEIRKVVLYVPDGSYGVMVEYSTDGKNYFTLNTLPVTGDYDPETGLVILPEAGVVFARYLRIACIGSNDNVLRLSEIEVYTSSDEPSALTGDINNDGAIDIKDVTALLNYLADTSNVPAAGIEALDLDQTGEIDIKDVTVLLNILSTLKD